MLRFAGTAEWGDDLTLMNMTVCNECGGLIVWPNGGGPETVRKGTPEEERGLLQTPVGAAVYLSANKGRRRQ